MQDEEVTVRLHVEENPVGMQDDAALIIESQSFSQPNQTSSDNLEESINFDIAVERFVNNRIVDPLKMTIGE